ncbi:MAG TPA: cytochrome c maturation protein CcmE [Anaerolineae bacterium]|nr:cytochrome c maturation protein CcmE [Anaerolineae bacterium]
MADSRSKKRLLVVTAVLLVIIGGMIYTSAGGSSVAYYETIGEAAGDPSNIGKSISVGGEVVEKSVVQNGNTATFKIFDQKHKSDQLTVVYTRQLPNPFGGGIYTVVTGKLVSKDRIEATKLVTKCPSKYEEQKEKKGETNR